MLREIYANGSDLKMASSNYKISIQPDYVLMERPRDYKVVLSEQPEMLMDLAAACKRANCRKVLIRGPKTTVELSPLEIRDLGKEIAKFDLRIAVSESHDASRDDVAFLENVVWNRGRPIKFFDSELEAKYWLRM
jgi:hypothetical protein